VDEKSQIQALDRTAPMLPLQPGLPERRTHDYVRHGTTTLFAALEIATGKVTATCQPRHRHQEFLRFLRQVARAYPEAGPAPGDGQLRRALPPRGPGLAGGPSPDHSALHPDLGVLDEPGRGVVLRSSNARPSTAAATAPSATSLPGSGPSSTAGTNATPFVWTKTAEHVLAKANRQKTSEAPH
jgi:hypothetical protein